METPPPIPELSWSSTRFGANGLQMRFRPRTRIRQAFFLIAPWVDSVLLLVAVLFVFRGGQLRPGASFRSLVLTPGIGVDLPSAPFEDGSGAAMLMVVNVRQAPQGAESGAAAPATGGILVFYDEGRYDFSQEEDRVELDRAIRAHGRGGRAPSGAAQLGERPPADAGEEGLEVILFVDRGVPFGDLAALLTALREAGVSRVSFATKTR